MKFPCLRPFLLLSLALLSAGAGAQSPAPKAAASAAPAPAPAPASSSLLRVENAWIRAAVPGQSGTGAFMRLTATQPLRLVGVSTPVAGVAEVHEMRMDGDVMRMRAIPGLDLPAGQAVELKPGSYHLMLMSLKAPLKADTRVPVTLLLRDAQGVERRLELQVPVSLQAPGAAAAPAPAGGHGHQHMHQK